MLPIDTPRGKFTRPPQYVAGLNPKYEHTPRNNYVPVSKSRLNKFSGYKDFYPLMLSRYTGWEHAHVYPSLYPLSSRSIFESSTVLPYQLNIPFSQVQKELDFLSPYYDEKSPRIPTLYRISDTWSIDDLGRLYKEGKDGTLRFRPYTLSGDLRNRFTLINNDGSKLEQSAYFFAGIAGYDPRVQDHFTYSARYDFHHIQENKLDLRPTAVIPLETQLHRLIHNERTNPHKFFVMSKKFFS